MNLPQVFVDAAREAGEKLEGWEPFAADAIRRDLANGNSLLVCPSGRRGNFAVIPVINGEMQGATDSMSQKKALDWANRYADENGGWA